MSETESEAVLECIALVRLIAGIEEKDERELASYCRSLIEDATRIVSLLP